MKAISGKIHLKSPVTGITLAFIGIALFLYMLYYPIKLLPKKTPQKPYVYVVIVYLATCFMTLEPFITGILSYYVFYMYK